ncbi:hypothetical protein BASA81_017934 [Batrachochytrium salamandrivorans]|nr:hypothetical protein BASA81_017934 [Batrachochytrium salamandrivorans]
MFDKEGHMIHIDFGFILSIAPGGGILEVSPFKLTAEMVQVMGGDINAPAYRQFSELCIKAYLACRPYAEEIISMVSLMMDSGYPVSKASDVTIRKLRERFQLDKSERGAAEFMVNCIRQSHENTRSGLYDAFQYLQNVFESTTRRWSSGVTKLQLGGLPDEHSTQPIRVQLGDEIMIYEKNQWHRDTENKQMLDLNERNRMLEGETKCCTLK